MVLAKRAGYISTLCRTDRSSTGSYASTRRAGPNLRVAVQLVEAETGAILWTQKFDRPLSQLAELQEDLVV